jgi:hypothetical protein
MLINLCIILPDTPPGTRSKGLQLGRFLRARESQLYLRCYGSIDADGEFSIENHYLYGSFLYKIYSRKL